MEDDTNMFYELFLGTTVWMRNTNGFKYDLTRLGYAMMLTFRLIDYTYLEMIKAPSDRSVYMKYIDALGVRDDAQNAVTGVFKRYFEIIDQPITDATYATLMALF